MVPSARIDALVYFIFFLVQALSENTPAFVLPKEMEGTIAKHINISPKWNVNISFNRQVVGN